jgi:hypothetical protein
MGRTTAAGLGDSERSEMTLGHDWAAMQIMPRNGDHSISSRCQIGAASLVNRRLGKMGERRE